MFLKIRTDTHTITPTGVFSKEKFPELTSLSYELLLGSYYSIISEICINTGAFYKLPNRLGEIGIAKSYQTNKKRLDYQKYNATGEISVTTRDMDGAGFFAF